MLVFFSPSHQILIILRLPPTYGHKPAPYDESGRNMGI